MKKHLLIPLLTAAGGVACFLLRLAQNRFGFEAGTGLPIPGQPLAILLPAALLFLAAVLLLLILRFPDEKSSAADLDFRDYFSSGSTAAAMVTVCGIFLWILSGIAGILPLLQSSGVIPGSAPGLWLPVDPVSAKLDMLVYGLSVPAALCLLPAAAAGRKGQRRALGDTPVNGNLILFPVIYLILRLALSYREMSVNASQQAYYPELLALMFLVLGLYRLSSFALHCGSTRFFLFYAAMGSVLCLVSLADPVPAGDRLFCLGGAALLLGFLLQRILSPLPPDPAAP